MATDDLSELFAAVRAQMLEAAATGAPQPGPGASGTDPDDYVNLRVDGRGLLENVVFDPAISELTPEELAEATMAALQDAQSHLSGRRPGDLPDIGRSEVHEKLARAFGLEED